MLRMAMMVEGADPWHPLIVADTSDGWEGRFVPTPCARSDTARRRGRHGCLSQGVARSGPPAWVRMGGAAWLRSTTPQGFR